MEETGIIEQILVRRLYCDSTKERRWGADQHWLQKAEHHSVIKCERYVLLTVEDILHKLKGSTIFTKLNVTSGFWQIPLDDELQPNSLHSSVHLADTSTADCHRALHLRQRFPSAPWKRSLQERSMLYVSGSSMTFSCSVKTRRRSSRKVTLEEHHAAKLNSAWARQLCHWSTTEEGVKADPRKTEAILEMPDPTDVAEIRRFLGMVNYLGRYLQTLSSVLQPLVTELLEADVGAASDQSSRQSQSGDVDFCSNTDLLTSIQASRATTVSADANQYGLGAVLLH